VDVRLEVAGLARTDAYVGALFAQSLSLMCVTIVSSSEHLVAILEFALFSSSCVRAVMIRVRALCTVSSGIAHVLAVFVLGRGILNSRS